MANDERKAEVLKALTIQQPWAWSVIHGGKNIENRNQRTRKERETIAVHASATLHHSDKFPRGALHPPKDDLEFSSIIGFVDIVGCVEKSPKHSKWHNEGCFGWVLENPRPLRKPIACSGARGFWEVPTNILRRCKAQLAPKNPLKLRTFRYSDAPKRGEGLRIGTTRTPPLRVPKKLWHKSFDVWFRLLAPSKKLRQRNKRGKITYREFCDLYERELLSKHESRQALDLLAAMAQRTPISIGCYCKNESTCHRSHLKKLIELAARKLKSGGIQK